MRIFDNEDNMAESIGQRVSEHGKFRKLHLVERSTIVCNSKEGLTVEQSSRQASRMF